MSSSSPTQPLLDDQGLPVYMTRAEASRYIRLSMANLADKTARGEVPSLQVGHRRLYRRVDLDQWMDGHLVGKLDQPLEEP